MKKDTKETLIGKYLCIEKVIEDLENSTLYSPFNQYFLRDRFVRDYKKYAENLKKKIEKTL